MPDSCERRFLWCNKAGQKMVIIAYDNRMVLIPERSIQEARGSLKGMDGAIKRDEEDRL